MDLAKREAQEAEAARARKAAQLQAALAEVGASKGREAEARSLAALGGEALARSEARCEMLEAGAAAHHVETSYLQDSVVLLQGKVATAQSEVDSQKVELAKIARDRDAEQAARRRSDQAATEAAKAMSTLREAIAAQAQEADKILGGVRGESEAAVAAVLDEKRALEVALGVKEDAAARLVVDL
jgi:hypothetical protein